MIRAELSSLVIYDSVLFQYGGQVHRWANRLERRFVMNSKEEAPKRSGELAAKISGESLKYGPKHWAVHIHSDAEHSLYVLQGTTGPIMSNRMWGFRNNPRYSHLVYPRGGAIGSPTKPRGVNMTWMHEHGYAMKLRPGNGFGTKLALTVEGQEANNFFARAAASTAVRHPSLRGFSPGFRY